ncbi:non-homologous end-joining DNA ligase [Salinimicrobium oceani]|uniref:ATP-dependent DNA ligase n=1 Tax=Salinimicrobium oceani TaxID=2722702 RepID=A0ABX1CZM2_9FLAO|nr:non-homologous end-joining DNA ligase [Salinimicrobium oceani]NJW53718.1 ATP-dependent DNA ligase [Salinimicrobium oceani]
MEVAGIEISHPDKIIFPQKKISKGDMVSYYERIAPLMLPFLKDRPLTLQRFPGGIQDSGFYQKNAADYFPDFIETVEVPTEEGSNTQIICNDVKTLVYLVNQGTVVFHTWLSRKDKLREPDKIVFDLDPPANAFEQVRKAARVLRDFLKEKGIEASLMTSGKNGLHLYYSKRRGQDFDAVKEEVRDLAEEAAALHPDLFTTKIRKDQREEKIFVDYLRNAYAQTAVCPYSLRATEDAGVATPISWDELSRLKSSSHYNIDNIFRRIGQKENK